MHLLITSCFFKQSILDASKSRQNCKSDAGLSRDFDSPTPTSNCSNIQTRSTHPLQTRSTRPLQTRSTRPLLTRSTRPLLTRSTRPLPASAATRGAASSPACPTCSACWVVQASFLYGGLVRACGWCVRAAAVRCWLGL
jgi:hypothetical protein